MNTWNQFLCNYTHVIDGEYYNIDSFKKHLGMFYIDNSIELKST